MDDDHWEEGEGGEEEPQAGQQACQAHHQHHSDQPADSFIPDVSGLVSP